jgi:hypothetical protein
MPVTVSWEHSGVVFCDERNYLQECVRLSTDAGVLLKQSRSALGFSSKIRDVSNVRAIVKEIAKHFL